MDQVVLKTNTTQCTNEDRMKKLTKQQTETIRSYANSLTMTIQIRRNGWTKQQALNRIKAYVQSGTSLTLFQFINQSQK